MLHIYKDINSLQNIGIATVGSMALNAMLGFCIRRWYLCSSCWFYYKDGQPVTRLYKYIVSDDSLDEERDEIGF